MIVENNKEFEALVMSLTDDELNYIIKIMNKNILPLLIMKKENEIIDKSHNNDKKCIISKPQKENNKINIDYTLKTNYLLDNRIIKLIII